MGSQGMKSVLVTPAGSGIGITTLKAFNEKDDIRTVATDVNNLAAGLHLADESYIVPPFDDDEYFDSIRSIALSENIDVIVPALDPILKTFADQKELLEESGASVMISDPQTIENCRDKWKTYTTLHNDVPFPDSMISLEEAQPNQVYFIKPRYGSGSEQAYKIRSPDELEFYFKRIEQPIIQEHLPGTEYTVDCLSARDGELLVCLPRKRVAMSDGISTKIAVTREPKLRAIAETVNEQFDFVGPFFIQAKEDVNGTPHVTEIGPRIAGTMCHGFVSPSLQYLGVMQTCGEHAPEPTVAYGTRMTRYWNEIYFETEPAVRSWRDTDSGKSE